MSVFAQFVQENPDEKVAEINYLTSVFKYLAITTLQLNTIFVQGFILQKVSDLY